MLSNNLKKDFVYLLFDILYQNGKIKFQSIIYILCSHEDLKLVFDLRKNSSTFTNHDSQNNNHKIINTELYIC